MDYCILKSGQILKKQAFRAMHGSERFHFRRKVMNSMLPAEIKDKIVSGLRSNSLVNRIILFGSYARGTPNSDSDVDLIVILNKKGFFRSYTEMIENRSSLLQPLLKLREVLPLDLFVYTIDEWATMEQSQNDFIKNVQKNGIVLA